VTFCRCRSARRWRSRPSSRRVSLRRECSGLIASCDCHDSRLFVTACIC
jgi:hypothetical protein